MLLYVRSTSHLKFVWSVDVQGMSSLAMTSMEAPNILLFSPANQTLMLHPLYSQPEAIANLKKQQISDFLSDVVSAKIPVSRIMTAYILSLCNLKYFSHFRGMVEVVGRPLYVVSASIFSALAR